MHVRRRMGIDSRIPTMPAQGTSGFTDQADLPSTSAQRREVFGE